MILNGVLSKCARDGCSSISRMKSHYCSRKCHDGSGDRGSCINKGAMRERPCEPGEEWRPINGFPLYDVSSFGRVWSKSRGRGLVLKPVARHNRDAAYLTLVVTLFRCDEPAQRPLGRRGQRPTFSVGVLVLETFVGPKPYEPADMQCRHLDDDAFNNRLTNLAWGTAKQNAEDRDRNGGTIRGVRVNTNKLTEAQAAEALRSTESGAELGRRWGVQRTTIGALRRGRNWKHLHGKA